MKRKHYITKQSIVIGVFIVFLIIAINIISINRSTLIIWDRLFINAVLLLHLILIFNSINSKIVVKQEQGIISLTIKNKYQIIFGYTYIALMLCIAIYQVLIGKDFNIGYLYVINVLIIPELLSHKIYVNDNIIIFKNLITKIEDVKKIELDKNTLLLEKKTNSNKIITRVKKEKIDAINNCVLIKDLIVIK